jgi:predicted dienelactone hydrolase
MRRLFALMPLLFGMHMAMAAVPVDIHAPTSVQACTNAIPCPVAILSPGYGLSGSDYSFVTNYLNGMGYLVVALQDSVGGVKMDPNAPVSKQVQALARVASQSISTAIDETAGRYPQFDWQHLLLVGHSLGGDSSAQFAADNANRVSSRYPRPDNSCQRHHCGPRCPTERGRAEPLRYLRGPHRRLPPQRYARCWQ